MKNYLQELTYIARTADGKRTKTRMTADDQLEFVIGTAELIGSFEAHGIEIDAELVRYSWLALGSPFEEADEITQTQAYARTVRNTYARHRKPSDCLICRRRENPVESDKLIAEGLAWEHHFRWWGL